MSTNKNDNNDKEVVSPQVEKKVDLIEGAAPLRDYRNSKNGEPVFETRSKEEWKQYCLKTNMININGSKPCGMCGIVVEYEEMQSHVSPLCEACSKRKTQIKYKGASENKK